MSNITKNFFNDGILMSDEEEEEGEDED